MTSTGSRSTGPERPAVPTAFHPLWRIATRAPSVSGEICTVSTRASGSGIHAQRRERRGHQRHNEHDVMPGSNPATGGQGSSSDKGDEGLRNADQTIWDNAKTLYIPQKPLSRIARAEKLESA